MAGARDLVVTEGGGGAVEHVEDASRPFGRPHVPHASQMQQTRMAEVTALHIRVMCGVVRICTPQTAIMTIERRHGAQARHGRRQVGRPGEEWSGGGECSFTENV